MDTLSDIMEATTIPDFLFHTTRPTERAVPVARCWGRGLTIKTLKQNMPELHGKGRGKLPQRPFFPNGSCDSFNADISAQLMCLEHKEKKHLEDDQFAVKSNPVFSKSKCIEYLKLVKSRHLSHAGRKTFVEEENGSLPCTKEDEKRHIPATATGVEKIKNDNYSSFNADISTQIKSFKPKADRYLETSQHANTLNKADGKCKKEVVRNVNFVNLPNEDDPFSVLTLKDVANLLVKKTENIFSLANIEDKENKGVNKTLKNTAALEIHGFSRDVTEESLIGYLESFGSILKIELIPTDDEAIVKIWMNNESECEWIISCLHEQEVPIGDSQRFLTVDYLMEPM